MTDRHVRIGGGQLIETGVLHKSGTHNVELTGTVGMTQDGRIRSHVLRTHVAGINGEQMLHIVGLHLDNVVEVFATTGDDTTFRRSVRVDSVDNFVYCRGGELRFGRLLMQDADLRIHGGDSSTPFDLDLPHYARQPAAGYSRTRADSGLAVFMPKLGITRRNAALIGLYTIRP